MENTPIQSLELLPNFSEMSLPFQLHNVKIFFFLFVLPTQKILTFN